MIRDPACQGGRSGGGCRPRVFSGAGASDRPGASASKLGVVPLYIRRYRAVLLCVFYTQGSLGDFAGAYPLRTLLDLWSISFLVLLGLVSSVVVT